ncbi:MAG: hypothetical protein LBM94_01540 [Propionibacteriaceae bacterium]|jgi:hypothetical protein|nr:hypothetical protein [Propionibacteriaceae bacterium]
MYLPHLPTLNADVVRLADGRLRLQSPNGDYCEVAHADGAFLDFLQRLDGLHGCGGLLRELDDDSRQQAQLLLEELAGREMLRESHPEQTYSVQLVGSGRLARQAALALLEDGRVQLLVTPVAASRVAKSPAEALLGPALKTRPEAAKRVSTGAHWSEITANSADLVLICPNTVEVDQAVVSHLLRVRAPHLLLNAHQDTARIGPLVDGYGGACAACGNQRLGIRDSDWLPVLAGLAGRGAAPNELLLRWVSAEAALRIGWFVAGTNTLRSTVLEASATVPGIVTRTIAPHPDCACQRRRDGRPKLRVIRSTPVQTSSPNWDALPQAA